MSDKYTDGQLAELKRLVPITSVAYSRVKRLNKNGGQYWGLCPFHDDSNPSFTIYQQGSDWLWRCMSRPECGQGNIFQLLMKTDKLSFEAAVEKVAEMAGWEKGKQAVERTFTPLVEKGAEKKVTFPLEKLKEAEDALETSPAGLEWLKSRGITLETAKKFHLGFVQSCAAVRENHPWEKDGWILFPTIEDQTITCLKYRSVKGKKTPEGEAAILRKKGMATPLFNGQAVTPFDDVFVVEGEPDAMVLAQAGYTAVAIPGAGFTLTSDMKDSLKLATRIYLAGDMDLPGQDTMHKIWSELRDKTYLIKWPDNQKDANDTLLNKCDGDTEKFHVLMEELKQKANESPMPFIYSLRESMVNADLTRPMDNPARLHFPWETVDKWTAILPGDVVCLSASNTGTGKTSLLMQILLDNAINYGKIVVNYSAELAPPQYTRRAVACLTGANRENLTKENFAEAVKILGNAQFYNGYRPKAKYAEAIETLVWAKRRLGADIISIDHIHFLVRGEKDEVKAQAEAMRMIKDLAVEFNIIVIVVGQPRKPQSGVKNREMVEYELKGSEAIASDASQVLIMHRDRVDNTTEGNPVFSNITKFKLDKSRESETKVALLWFRGDVCKFEMYGGQADGQATPAPPPEDEQGDFFPPGD